MNWVGLRRHLSNTIYAIAAMILGAIVLANYLEWNDPGFKEAWGMIDDELFLPFWLSIIVGNALNPWLKPDSSWSGRFNPDYSGAIVVAIIGTSAAIIVWWNQSADQGLVVPVVIAAATIVCSVAAWRFAKARGAEIGEARFVSSNSPSSLPQA